MHKRFSLTLADIGSDLWPADVPTCCTLNPAADETRGLRAEGRVGEMLHRIDSGLVSAGRAFDPMPPLHTLAAGLSAMRRSCSDAAILVLIEEGVFHATLRNLRA